MWGVMKSSRLSLRDERNTLWFFVGCIMFSVRPISAVLLCLVFSAQILSPRFAFAERELLIRSSEDALNFAVNAEPTSAQGEQFVLAVLEWALHKEDSDERPLGSIVIVPRSDHETADVHLGAREEVAYLIASEKYGVTHFTPSMYDLIATATTTEHPLTGICGVIAALHSAVEMKVAPEEAIFEKGKIKPAAIATAKLATGDPATIGTTLEDEKNIHKYFAEKYKNKVICNDSEYKVTSANLMDVAEKIDKEKEDGSDCWGRATGSSEGGHAFHILGVEKTGRHSYEFKFLDTANQGDGRGDNVPKSPGTQTVGMRAGHAGKPPTMSYRAGPDREFWGQFLNETKKFTVQCCHVEKDK